MHREAWDEMSECAVCGVAVDVGRERGYRTGDGQALCWSCAVARGARFDEEEDRWLVEPDTSDIPPALDRTVP